MKKTIAITTAIISLLISGCGSIEEEEKAAALKADTNISSVLDSEESSSDEGKADSSAASGSDSPAANSSESESGWDYDDEEENIVYENIANLEGYKGEYIGDGNCAVLNPSNFPEMDKEMLYYAAELAVKQYNCIARRDKKGFFDMMGIDRLMRSEFAPRFWAQEFSDEELYVPNSEIYDGIVFYCHDLLGKELGDLLDKYEDCNWVGKEPYPYDKMISELTELLNKGADMVSVDNADIIFDKPSESCFNHLFRKYKSIDESEFFSDPEKFVITPSEDTRFIIKYGNISSARFDEGVATDIDVIVLDGEYAYHFDDCRMWLTGSESNVTPFYVAVTENRWKGLTAKEAGEKIYDEYYSDEANIASELFYYADQFIYPDQSSCDPSFKPPTWDELIASGDFALAASEKGFDLSKDTPEAYGDLDLTMCYGIDKGTVYLIHEPDDDQLFYIRYVSPDGKVGEYHREDNHWF